uniref:Thioredoxin domain-containing protein n=1 Tax=Ostreococcus mediterraneus TaxID=1486918 RepID=A0A7S0KJH6_9CHLO|mmetsp:Transcript_586/g.2328  ORF Transcript_586/g.2328 Transcript_586/m.2328 type:complete len:240 (+) Transcript_586:95-814(+)
MDDGKFQSTMNSLNYGTVMEAAAKNYMKEKLEEEANARARPRGCVLDARDLAEDPDLEAIHAERMQSLKDAAEKRMTMERTGHGSLNEVEEKEFLPEVTTTAYVVAHFYHHEFERCRIMDKHLALLAKKYFDTKFIKVSAPDAPFFVTKLQIQVLPCVLFFRDGVCFDRLVGFEDVGGKDDYRTEKLENILLKAGVIALPEKHESDSEDEEEEFRREAMSRVIRGGVAYGSDDESSDFE